MCFILLLSIVFLVPDDAFCFFRVGHLFLPTYGCYFEVLFLCQSSSRAGSIVGIKNGVRLHTSRPGRFPLSASLSFITPSGNIFFRYFFCLDPCSLHTTSPDDATMPAGSIFCFQMFVSAVSIVFFCVYLRTRSWYGMLILRCVDHAVFILGSVCDLIQLLFCVQSLPLRRQKKGRRTIRRKSDLTHRELLQESGGQVQEVHARPVKHRSQQLHETFPYLPPQYHIVGEAISRRQGGGDRKSGVSRLRGDRWWTRRG